MMRLLFVPILVFGFIIGLIVFTPLEYILKASGAADRGLSWTSIEGTLTGGRITGLRANGELLGDAALKLNPSAFLRLAAEYGFDWTGPSGAGTGKVSGGMGGKIEIRDFDIEIDFSALDGMALWVRQSGGKARLYGDVIRFENGACDEAMGQTWSDALGKNEALLGPGWPDMTGELSCDRDALLIPFSSQSASGTRVDAAARFGFDIASNLEARVTGFIPQQFQHGLPVAGFVQDGSGYVYRYPPVFEELSQ